MQTETLHINGPQDPTLARTRIPSAYTVQKLVKFCENFHPAAFKPIGICLGIGVRDAQFHVLKLIIRRISLIYFSQRNDRRRWHHGGGGRRPERKRKEERKRSRQRSTQERSRSNDHCGHKTTALSYSQNASIQTLEVISIYPCNYQLMIRYIHQEHIIFICVSLFLHHVTIFHAAWGTVELWESMRSVQGILSACRLITNKNAFQKDGNCSLVLHSEQVWTCAGEIQWGPSWTSFNISSCLGGTVRSKLLSKFGHVWRVGVGGTTSWEGDWNGFLYGNGQMVTPPSKQQNDRHD